MTNFQFSKSLQGPTIIIHLLIVKMYQLVAEYRPLRHTCMTYQTSLQLLWRLLFIIIN